MGITTAYSVLPAYWRELNGISVMMTFYAAIGSYRIKVRDGHKVPYIQKLGKLHEISIPEFTVWSILLWEFMTYDELKKYYDEQIKALGVKAPSLDELLEFLLRRKLIAKGVGYTGCDALYNMLSVAFVVPYQFNGGRRFWTLLKLWICGKIRFLDLLSLVRETRGTDDEARVLALVEQTPLSTSELIRCFERGIQDVSTPEKVIAAVYPEEDNDQAHIASEEMLSAYTNSVLQAVSNLYLSRKVILELA